MFEDVQKANVEDIKNQRISTYIYLILLTLSVAGLILYTSLTPLTKTSSVQNPTLEVFRELERKHLNTLVCPCNNILIEFRTFILSFSPTFDPICSSNFISDDWLKHINYRPLNNMKYQFSYDFRHTGYSFFQMLKYLCEVVSQTIDEQLIEFYSNTLLSDNVMSEVIFNATHLANKNQFINITRNTFLTSLNTIRTVVRGNTIINRLNTNYYHLQIFPTNNGSILYSQGVLLQTPYSDNKSSSCFCGEHSYCKINTGIYRAYRRILIDESPNSKPDGAAIAGDLQFLVPGVNVGCLMLDAVLQSDLKCMYDEQCLSKLEMHLNEDTPNQFTATPLNYSTVPPMPLTIGELIENLIVKEWQFNSSYDLYFKQCNPSQCTYTYFQQFDIIYVTTTTIGFIGGIATILMFMILPVVTSIRQHIIARRSTSDQGTQRTHTQRFSLLISKIKSSIITLNLFKNPEKETEHDLRNQVISTRVYICLLILALIILSFYTLLTYVTQTVTIDDPTFHMYTNLEEKNPICPCKHIAVEYQKFITFKPTFHSICASDFVTQNWTNYFQTYDITHKLDFRSISQMFFISLSDFCQLSLQTIQNHLLSFNSTKYVTKNLQSSQLFQSETQQIVNFFIRKTNNSFHEFLSILRHTIIGDQLITSSPNFFFKRLYRISNDLITTPILLNIDNVTFCSCKLSPIVCGQKLDIYNGPLGQLSFRVPGVRGGCFPIESILESTLECFFDQSCLNTIYNLIASTSEFPYNATAMTHSNTSRYYRTTKIIQIVQQLMIEEWNNQISFESYFNQCMPEKCFYTYYKRADGIYMISTIIGIFGGLITVFRIIIPPFVIFLRRKKREAGISTSLASSQRQSGSCIERYLRIANTYIRTFNLFKNANRRSEEHLKHQRLSTRLFIFLSLISLIILLFYTSLHSVTHSFTIRNPTNEQLNFLFEKYSDGLQCPCKISSITYKDFTSFQPESHSICRSIFTTSTNWLTIDYPPSFHNDPIIRTEIDDFRYIASPFFQTLASFCQLTRQTIETELLTFNSTTYISPNLIRKEEFQRQTNQMIISFKENTARSFTSSLRLINQMIHFNQLSSGLATDSVFTADPQYHILSFVFVYNRKDRVYQTANGLKCNCQQTPTCIQQANVYGLDRNTSLFLIPGINVGCYVVEALLQSDLRCFFDVDCITKLIHTLKLSSDHAYSNPSLYRLNSSRYRPEASLQELVSNLMIEQWNNETFYENYFNICQPKECTVTYISRGNVLYIITTIISLIGGLTEVYNFLTPILARLVSDIIWPFAKRTLTRNRIAQHP